MKALMIAAPASGSGKTTITMGLLRALKNRGLDVCGYKTGPDYIDRAFLDAAAGKPGGNLDLHLQGERGISAALASARSDYCVIEGVMGYFDGIYNTWQGSSYHIADLLNIPTVLIYTPGAEMFSIVPKLKGMAEFERSTIRAVIFNNVSPQYYRLIKEPVEQYTNLTALGYVPKLPGVSIKSRHLGLVQSVETADLDQKIETIAEALEEHIDLSAAMRLMRTPRPLASVQTPTASPASDIPQERGLCVAIAKDQAFSFYYRENIDLLEQRCRVVYFSPLHDESLPDCDLLYLGGGYPEVFKEQLAQNRSMLVAIKAYAERGGAIYAECGGFMYLTESIDGTPMVGIFRGATRLTSKLQRFGYIDIRLKADCPLGRAGDRLTGHEFHKSISEVEGATFYDINKTMGATSWEGGYRYKNVFAGYPHLNFSGYPDALNSLLDYVKSSGRQR